MARYVVEMRGLITRDIRYLECDADDEDAVRNIAAHELPTHKVFAINPAQHVDGCPQKIDPSETCICDELETDQ